MNGFGQGVDLGRLIAATLAAATVLFLLAGRLRGRAGRAARAGAMTLYGVLFAGVLIYVALWLLGVRF